MHPLFPAGWPGYAKAAHIAFWAVSAAFVLSIAGGIFRIISANVAILLFGLWLVAAAVLGAAAMFSAKLYYGNQVFSRTPLEGWPARLAGGYVLAGASAFLFFAYALLQMHGN